MIVRTLYDRVQPFTTKDGSTVRELMHPAVHGNVRQSLAEATLLPGLKTLAHRHHKAEELYHITAGTGLITLGNEISEVKTGDTVYIPPGTVHRIENTGDGPLILLCCCSPPYSHDDTELVGGGDAGGCR